MTTYPLTFPNDVAANALRIVPQNAVAISESPFSYTEKAYSWGGERWIFDVSLPPLKRDVAEKYISFLTALRGPYGTFTMRIPAHRAPQGVGTGTPLVKGAGQTGYTLLADGFTNSVTGILKAGDFINLGTGSASRLHKVTSDVNSNGSGEVTIPIWPALRASPADNASVYLTDCVCHLRLDGDPAIDLTVDRFYNISFRAVEVL